MDSFEVMMREKLIKRQYLNMCQAFFAQLFHVIKTDLITIGIFDIFFN